MQQKILLFHRKHLLDIQHRDFAVEQRIRIVAEFFVFLPFEIQTQVNSCQRHLPDCCFFLSHTVLIAVIELIFYTAPEIRLSVFDDFAQILVNFGICEVARKVFLNIIRSGDFKHVDIVKHLTQFF